MRKAFIPALAALFLLSLDAPASAATSFACKTYIVKVNNKRLDSPLPKALDAVLKKAKLSSPFGTQAPDLELAFTLRTRPSLIRLPLKPTIKLPDKPDAHSAAAPKNESFDITLTITSTTSGDSSAPVKVADNHTLDTSNVPASERELTVLESADDEMAKSFEQAIQQYRSTHHAGLLVDVTPEATVTFDFNGKKTSSKSPATLGCMRKGMKVAVVAEREGYKRQEQTNDTFDEMEGRDVVIRLERNPTPGSSSSGGGGSTSSSSSSSSSTSTSGGSLGGTGKIETDDEGVGKYALWIAIGVLGLVVIVLVLARLGRKSPAPAPAPAPASAPARLKVLYLAANPKKTDRLRLDKEVRNIADKLREGKYRDVIDFIPEQAVRLSDVIRALREHKPQIVHFAGHADEDGIVLEDPHGDPAHLSREVLEKLFRSFDEPEDRIRLVLLNACYSAEVGQSLSEVVDVIIGTTRALDDDDAIAFAEEFYGAISFGRSANSAYEQGTLAALASAEQRAARGDAKRGSIGGQKRPEDKDLFALIAKKGADPAQIRFVGELAKQGNRA